MLGPGREHGRKASEEEHQSSKEKRKSEWAERVASSFKGCG